MRLLLSGLLVMIGAGCALKSDAPPPVIYALRMQEDIKMPEAAVIATDIAADKKRVMHVARPAVPPGFDTDRVALYRDGGRKLDYYAVARWPDIFDLVLQDFMTQAAAHNLPYLVARAGPHAQSDVRLQIKVIDFQPVYVAGPEDVPEIIVGLEFTLVAAGDERIINNFTLTRRQLVAENRLDLVMAALNESVSAVAAEAFALLDADLRALPPREKKK